MIIRIPYLRLIQLLVFAALCSAQSFAADKVQFSKEPDWLVKAPALVTATPASKLVSSGYFLRLLDRQINVGQQCNYTHVIRQVINETGVQNASEVSVSYSPAFQQISIHSVRVIRDGLVVSKAGPGDFKIVEDESDAVSFQYSGMKRAFVVLKDIRRNDQVDYSYSLIGFNPVFDNKYSGTISFVSGTPAVNHFETLIVPADRKLFFKQFNDAGSPTETVAGNLKIFRWDNAKSKVWQSQPGVPSWYSNFPYILVSEYENWQQVVDWGLKAYNNYQLPLSPAIEEQMAKWRKAAGGNKDEFANLALHFVQDEIRYLGMEIGVNTHQPHAPAEVFKQRFGDCKDKAFLLASILQKENIPAYAALVNTDIRGHLDEVIASPNVFDHVILAVERNKEFFFVDPTAVSQRGEFVNTYVDPYEYALVLKYGERKLQKVEAGFRNEVVIREELTIDVYDSSTLDVTTVYSGGKADEIRQSTAGLSATDLDQDFIDYYSRTYDGITKSADVMIVDDTVENKLTITEVYEIPQISQEDGNGKRSIPVFAKSIYSELPNPADTYKDGPVALTYPLQLFYTLTVNMPDLFAFKEEEFHVQNDSYKFDFRVENSGSGIKFIYSFKTFKDHIPKEELARYKKDYKKMIEVIDFGINTNGVDEKSSPRPGGNLIMYAYIVTLMIVFGLLLRFLNNRSVSVNQPEPSVYDAYYTGEQPLSGWLIVLTVTLAIGVLLNISNFLQGDFFSADTWQNLNEAGGARLLAVLMAEAFFRLLWLCGTLALLYWIVLKRDIFPSMFIWYVGTLVGGSLLLLTLAVYNTELGDELVQARGMDLMRSCIYGFLWTTYLLRSSQVKEVFVRKA